MSSQKIQTVTIDGRIARATRSFTDAKGVRQTEDLPVIDVDDFEAWLERNDGGAAVRSDGVIVNYAESETKKNTRAVHELAVEVDDGS
jgi:hypothetical protein